MDSILPVRGTKRFAIAAGAGIVVLALVVIGLLAWPVGGRSSTAGPTGGSSGSLAAGTRTNDANAVTVSVEWAGPGAGPAFKVALDTHSVNLDGYDLARLATLRVDQGPDISATQWTAPLGGHHRDGSLQFPPTTSDGRPLIGPATQRLELVIRDVAGVPQRTFEWP